MMTSATGSIALLLYAVPALSATAAIGDWDPQFGNGGHIEVAGNWGPNVLELSDGLILVVGTSTLADGSGLEARQVVLSRYFASGEPDASFGDGGHVNVVLSLPVAGISAVAQQHDGKVVMAGTSWSTQGAYSFIARVDAAGALDASFGVDGIAAIAGTEPYYGSVAVLPTGVIVAPISDWTSDRVDRFATDGQQLQDRMRIAFAPNRLALQHDGRIIVSGWHRELKQPGVVRLALDGSVDMTFGTDGFAALDADYWSSLAVEPGTDRIVLCGPGLVRLTADGHLDPTFGAQATGYVAFGKDSVPPFDYCRRLLPMWDGTLVYIGAGPGEAAPGYARAYVAGLTSDGTADLRFGAGTGARDIEFGGVGRNPAPYPDFSSALVRTHDGDALLTWQTDASLQLARIDLDAGTGSDIPLPPISIPPELPPVAVPPESPPASPSAPPAVPSGNEIDGGSAGGGGAWGWLDLGLLVFGSGSALTRRRRRNGA